MEEQGALGAGARLGEHLRGQDAEREAGVHEPVRQRVDRGLAALQHGAGTRPRRRSARPDSMSSNDVPVEQVRARARCGRPRGAVSAKSLDAGREPLGVVEQQDLGHGCVLLRVVRLSRLGDHPARHRLARVRHAAATSAAACPGCRRSSLEPAVAVAPARRRSRRRSAWPRRRSRAGRRRRGGLRGSAVGVSGERRVRRERGWRRHRRPCPAGRTTRRERRAPSAAVGRGHAR